MTRLRSRIAPWAAAFLLVGYLALSGCDGCGRDDPGADASGAAGFELGPLPEEIPLPGAVYQRAFDAALVEITSDNARERLREIERNVARERRELD